MEDTIAAISTSTVSSGGISIVRISGPDAIIIGDKVFKSKKNIKLANVQSHTVHFGNICDNGNEIDEALVIVMKSPNTYTRENIVEIDCHGGILVTKKVLEAVLNAGARLAEPGEFTKRAFLNGRIDLSQAEAVIDIINAKNDYALKSSVNQLDGKLSEKIKNIREIILNNVAFIEAALDDPEHFDIDANVNNLKNDVENCLNNVDNLLKTCDNGRIMHDGVRTVILGKTNAGKSSLLNVLAREERAIVTDIEGTTRDTLEEMINLSGVTLNLIDTAGIRKTDDVVESIGVNKAKKLAEVADLVIYVVDSSRVLDDNDYEIMELIKDKKVLVILNKADLAQVTTAEDIKKIINCETVTISAKQETGIEELEETVKSMFFNGEVHILTSILRVGAPGSHTDTASTGKGYTVGIGLNGQLNKEGYNIYGERRTSTSSGRMFENVVLCGHDEICSQIKKAHKMLSRFGIISWDFAVDENGEPILIEYNLNYPDVMIYQMNNGPLFGDLTQTVLEDVREKLKKER